MIDFRLYRIAFVPALAAFVVMMFSLEGVPEPPDPQIAPAAFDGERARANAREILALGDERTPGSEADAGAAALVLERFGEIEAGTATEQAFEVDSDGEPREVRNVALTLVGESDEVVLVTAGRDAASGPGAASSAAATAMLLELAETLGGTEHTKTFVLVSTAASTEGAAGLRRFMAAFEEPERIEAAIALHQPGSADPTAPFVLRHSTDERSTSMQLVRIAEETLAEQTGREPSGRGLLADLARLALPMAAGEQSVLIAEGFDAIGISSAGERPLGPADDGPEQLDPAVLTEFGAATLGMILILDPLTQPLQHGPNSYLEFSGSLVPGWSVAAFALALLFPAGLAALDGVARAARRRGGIVRALAWALALAVPLAVGALIVRLLGLIGVIADPPYPFDPGRFDLGLGEVALLAVLAGILGGAYHLAGLSHPPRRPWRAALAPALGVAAFAGGFAVWLLNPFLALLLVPCAHAWLLAAAAPRRRALTAALAVVSVLPAALALRSSAGAVGAGPWDLALMVADGQLSSLVLIAAAPILGSLGGLLALAWHTPEARTDDREGLGARPQGTWVPGESSPAPASIDPDAPGADEFDRTGNEPRRT
ncbi:MAG: M28 family peptidase [Solirubrobacterales bacterium]